MMLVDSMLVFECNRASFLSLTHYQSKLYISNNSLEKKEMSNSTKINFKQKHILGEFMCEHSDLAKGILPNTSQGKATANRLWENLALKLNSSGPPLKDAKTWRKVYADQKQLVKRKVSFNKSSKKKTGGGPFEEKYLSAAEEQILEAAGINVAVEGLKEVCTFGSQIEEIDQCTSAESTSQRKEADETMEDMLDDEESEETQKGIRPLRIKFPTKETRETKTFLLKKNISTTEKYQQEVLKRLDKIIEIKEKKLEMNGQLHKTKMEIKKIELQIKKRELERLQRNSNEC